MTVIASYPDDRKQFQWLLYLIRIHEAWTSRSHLCKLSLFNFLEKALMALMGLTKTLTWFWVRPHKLSATKFNLFVGILSILPFFFFHRPKFIELYLFFTCWALTEKFNSTKYICWHTIFEGIGEFMRQFPPFTSPEGNSETEAFGPIPRLREFLRES